MTAAASRAEASLPADVFVERANEAFGLLASDVVTLAIDAVPGVGFAVVVPVRGTPLTLNLWPHSVRSVHYDLVVQRPDGSYESVEPGPVRTLRGSVLEVEGAVVAGSLLDEG